MAHPFRADHPPIPPDGRPQVVLIGASNLTLGLSAAVRAAQDRVGVAADIYMANGHGRSYGITTQVLGVARPGIIHSGLFDAISTDASMRLPLHALLTDVGNDILYEVPVATILHFVRHGLERLAARRGAEISIATLPMESLRRVGRRRFIAVRTLLFPRCRLSFAEGMNRAEAVDARLRELATEFGANIVIPQRDWYGVDPIHIRFRRRAVAWETLLADWSQPAAPRSKSTVTLLRTRPARTSFRGRQRQIAQPFRMLRDGSNLFAY